MEASRPTLHTAAIAALELAVNRALALDPAASGRLARLQGQVFKLSCTNPALDLFLCPRQDKLQMLGYWDGEVTTTIRGKASDFADLATASDPTAALINGELELDGDSGPLIELQKAISALDLDWEAPLVDALGDVAGHQLAQGLRGLFSWGQQASSSLARQLEEFIHEEARLTPPRQELEDFYGDVGRLDQRVDRLQARVRKMAQRISREAG